MSDLQRIQELLKDISELMQQKDKKAKRAAVVKLETICAIATTVSHTLQLDIKKT